MSPITDLTLAGVRQASSPDQDLVLTPGLISYLVTSYLNGADPKNPLASPLFGELADLPPLLIQVGSTELLRSDSERFVTAVRGSGGQVDLHIADRLPHVYPAMA